MAQLRQYSDGTQNGKWKIVGIKHDDAAPSGVTIPATFSYRNKEVHLNITTTPQTVPTEWATQLGTKINLDEIDRKYNKVTRKEGDKWITYVAYDEFSDDDVIPFEEILEVSCSNTEPSSEGGSATLSISSNTSWVVTVEYSGSSTGWVHVPVTAGTGDYTGQTITFDPNTGTTDRFATIIITCGSIEKRIQIKQSGFVPTISITAPSVAATATSISYTVSSNVDAVTVKCSNGQSATTKTGSFTIPANTGTTEKTYIITAYCTDYPSYSATTTVTQSAAGAVLSASCSNTSPGSQQTEATLSITSNTSWTASSNVDWITITNPTGNGNGTRPVTFSKNSSTEPRTGKIIVTGGGITREITVTQAGAAPADTFDISAPGAMVPAVGGTVTLTITSNTSWTIASNQSWATLSKNSGTGNDTVTLTLAENTSDLRTVRISGTGGTATDYVDVKQEARGQLLPPEIHDVGINIEDTKTPVTIRFSYKGDKYYPDKIKVSVQLKKTNPLDPTPPIYFKEFTLQTGTDSFESVINTENFYVGSEFSAWITFENHSTDLEGSLIYSDSVPQESDFITWVITRAWDDIIADDGNTLYIRIKPLQQ